MKRILLSLLLALLAKTILACSCTFTNDYFCYGADSVDHIALVELISFHDESAVSFKRIENINKEIPDTIDVLGQDGLNCNLDLGQFSVGDTLVINTYYSSVGIPSAVSSIVYHWDLFGCTRHFLRYSEGVVYGKLDNTTQLEEFDYQTFKDNIFDCIDFTSSTQVNLARNILTYPNPVSNELRIESNNINISKINLYNFNGQIVNSIPQENSGNYRMDISNKQNGIYLLEIITPEGILRRKILKMN